MARERTGILNRFLRDSDGAFMIEFGLVFPVLMILSLGLLEFSLLAFDYQRAAEASRRAVRMAVITDAVANTANLLNDPPETIICTSASGTAACAGGSASADADARFQALLTEMQKAYPPITEDNLTITYESTDVGCSDCAGGILPLITIELSGVQYNFIVGYLIGVDSISMPSFKTSVLGSGRVVNAVVP